MTKLPLDKLSWATIKNGKFTKIDHRKSGKVPKSDPLYVSPVHLDKVELSYKAHNILGIYFMPFVVTDIDQFHEVFDGIFTNMTITMTDSKALGRRVHQVWVHTQLGSADRHCLKWLVQGIYKAYPSIFFTKYPSTNSYVDVPEYGNCELVSDCSDSQPFNQLINNLRLIDINVPHCAAEEIGKRQLDFATKNVRFEGEFISTTIASNYVNLLTYLWTKTNDTPAALDKRLTNDILDSLRWDFINGLIPVISLGIHTKDVPYPSVPLTGTIQGTKYLYNIPANSWSSNSILCGRPIDYPENHGVWRAKRFMEVQCGVPIPDILDTKTNQIKKFMEKNGNQQENEVVAYLKRRYKSWM